MEDLEVELGVESQAARGKLRGIMDKSSYIKILQQEDVSGWLGESTLQCRGHVGWRTKIPNASEAS